MSTVLTMSTLLKNNNRYNGSYSQETVVRIAAYVRKAGHSNCPNYCSKEKIQVLILNIIEYELLL